MGDPARWAGLIGANLPSLLGAFGLSVLIAVAAMIAALAVGTVVAVAGTSRWRVVRFVAFWYVQIFRGVALYVLIIWVYFGLAISLNVDFAPIPAGILTLALLNSAYLAEIIRTGLIRVDPGQAEAGQALGLSGWVILTSITMPQALRTMVPALGNQFTDVLKDTSILAVIAVPELMYVSQNGAQQSSQPFPFYTFAAVLYIVAVTLITAGVRRIERRGAAKRSRTAVTAPQIAPPATRPLAQEGLG